MWVTEVTNTGALGGWGIGGLGRVVGRGVGVLGLRNLGGTTVGVVELGCEYWWKLGEVGATGDLDSDMVAPDETSDMVAPRGGEAGDTGGVILTW